MLNNHQAVGRNRETPVIRGPIFAIVTPFKRSGEVDYVAFAEYLAFLHHCGVPALVVNGTTGEFPSMTQNERITVMEFCRGHYPGKLIANVSANCFKDCRSLVEHACAGIADAAILLPPSYYADATFEGLVAYYRLAIGRSTIPVFLYNFPRHTKTEVTPELLSAICSKNPQVRGIKDSSGSLNGALALKSARPDIVVFVGSDSLALATLEKGLDGSVTGGGNPIPECLVGLTKAFEKGRFADAAVWQRIMDGWRSYRKNLSILEIAAAKAGLAARIPGFPTYLRPPLSSPERQAVEDIARHMTNVLIPAIDAASSDAQDNAI